MACRVGISTDPDERIDHWKQVEGHTHSEVLYQGLTYEEATYIEKIEADKRECGSSPGGERVGGEVWSIYHVWGGR